MGEIWLKILNTLFTESSEFFHARRNVRMMYVLIISVKEKNINQVKPCCDQRNIFLEFKTDDTTKTLEQEISKT